MTRLSLRGISKDYAPVRVLKDVKMHIDVGEIVGIVGENGAGKSTLLNILSGTTQPTSGEIRLDDRVIRPQSYLEANKLGIWRVFQDSALIPGIPVYENLFLGHEKQVSGMGGLVAKRRLIDLAQQCINRMNIDLDVREPAYRFDLATRQALEIARTSVLPDLLGNQQAFVLFDEPTTGLTAVEVDNLVTIVRDLRERGRGVGFISHRLEEMRRLCDRVYVIKDGAVVYDGTPGDVTDDELHRLMVGRKSMRDLFYEDDRADVVEQPPSLVVRDVRDAAGSRTSRGSGRLREVSFSVHPGEIVGIGGQLGSGKATLVQALSGVLTSTGEVQVDDVALSGDMTRRKRAGLAVVPGDRKGESIVATLSVSENMGLANGDHGPYGFTTRLGVWRKSLELRGAVAAIEKFEIKASPGTALGKLSGGNQQKVALAKWVHRNPRVLVIENPTAGVDIGAKAHIYRELRRLASEGCAIVVVSDELLELIGLSDRILVMRDGRIVKCVDVRRDGKPEEHDLIAAMTGADIHSSDGEPHD